MNIKPTTEESIRVSWALNNATEIVTANPDELMSWDEDAKKWVKEIANDYLMLFNEMTQEMARKRIEESTPKVGEPDKIKSVDEGKLTAESDFGDAE